MTNRQLFLRHVAQTSPAPMALELVKANGIHMWDAEGRQYTDLISGFSVMNMGHGQPTVLAAIQTQTQAYMHLMVYGEIIESPQVRYAHLLSSHLPSQLDCVYFTNSGTEATEGAMKLAKRVTNRSRILSFSKAYHGSTQGSLSLMGAEYWRHAYRPLLPDVWQVGFNTDAALEMITPDTAAVVMEVVQAEAGVHAALRSWLHAVRTRCSEVGALLIFDEIQTGFGRTGTLWAFEQYGVVPDILLLGKALGGGMPLGAFISAHALMQQLTFEPVLGHISTFAGHPVSCAAGMASFQLLLETFFPDHVPVSDTSDYAMPHSSIAAKEELLRRRLYHPAIHAVRSRGLLMAIDLGNPQLCLQLCHACVRAGLLTDWFLFAPHCLRIAPPLIITPPEIEMVCDILLNCLEQVAPSH